MIRAWMTVVSLALPLVPWGVARAAPTFDEVSRWLMKDLAAAATFPAVSLCEVLYSVEIQNTVTPQAIRELEQTVARDQERSTFFILEHMKSRLGKPNEVNHRRAWILDERNWRVNSEYEGAPERFHDSILREKWACMSSIAELAVFDPRAGYPESRDVGELRVLISHALNALLYGGLSELARGEPSREDFRADGGSFSLLFDRPAPGKARYLIEGEWNPTLSRGFVTDIWRLTGTPDGERIPVVTCLDWVYDAETGLWFASKVMRYHHETGALERIIRFQNVARITRTEFERVTALPSPVGGDAVRGPIAYRAVSDFRADPVQRKERPTDRPLPTVTPAHRALSDPSLWRSAGWAAFGGFTLAIIILFVKRRMAA